MNRLDREPIYLCTMDELVGGIDEARGDQQFTLLAGVLEKLGYRLASGVAPNYHELWAVPIQEDAVAPTLH